MRTQLSLTPSLQGHMASTRVSAQPLREKTRELLSKGNEVVLNFQGVQVTQSFIDELVGVLILQDGPDILTRIVFKNCSEDVEAIIRFVATDRSDQYIKAHSH